MVEREDWRDLPLTPEIKRFIEASRRTHMDERQSLVRFAPMLCTCSPWYDWKNPEAPQLDCMVHTTIMFDNGTWL